MAAYIVVELIVKNQEARDRYSAAASPILKSFGGEFIAGGPWTVLFGEPAFANGAIIKFEDKDKALGFYNAPAYQALLQDRALGLDCRFRLLG